MFQKKLSTAILIFILYFSVLTACDSADKPRGIATGDSTYIRQNIYAGQPYYAFGGIPMSEPITNKSKTFNFDWDDIKNSITEARDKLCSVIKNGQLKFWLQAEASGKIVFVLEGRAEAGFEVIIECGKK